MRHISRRMRWAVAATIALIGARPLFVSGQSVSNEPGGPLSGIPIVNAPVSATMTLTASMTRPDGDPIIVVASGRLYRDSAGRVRVDQTIPNRLIADGASRPRTVITLDLEPDDPWVDRVDPASRTVGRGYRNLADLVVGGGPTFSIPLGQLRYLVLYRPRDVRSSVRQSLGASAVGGIEAQGWRYTVPATDDVTDAARAEIVDERWHSQALGLLLYSRYSDPRIGVVEYRLSDITLAEPPQDLFAVPPAYRSGYAMGEDEGLTLVPWSYAPIAAMVGKRAP